MVIALYRAVVATVCYFSSTTLAADAFLFDTHISLMKIDEAVLAFDLLVDELSDEVLSDACSDLRDAIEQLSMAVDKHACARVAALAPDLTFEFDHLIEPILDFVVRDTHSFPTLYSHLIHTNPRSCGFLLSPNFLTCTNVTQWKQTDAPEQNRAKA